MNKKVNWGIIGLGNIAHKFAADLQLSNSSVLYGVASRDISKAKVFCEKFESATYYGSYEELADDAEVDVIYIATPHSFHLEHSLMCLRNGKAVLCEKPMGINAYQVEQLIREAQSRNLFLMEGIWTRFIPAIEKYLDFLDQEAIGQIVSMQADFGFPADPNPNGRLYNKDLGGGSLLDIGIYPIYLSLLTLGLPDKIRAKARFTDTGVDKFCSMQFDYKEGVGAHLTSSFESDTPTVARIRGTKGNIKLHRRFHHTEKITIEHGGQKKVINRNYKGNGYIHEIEEVNTCLANQETESSKLPLTTSIDLIHIIDRVKEEIGLKYEKKSGTDDN